MVQNKAVIFAELQAPYLCTRTGSVLLGKLLAILNLLKQDFLFDDIHDAKFKDSMDHCRSFGKATCYKA